MEHKHQKLQKAPVGLEEGKQYLRRELRVKKRRTEFKSFLRVPTVKSFPNS